MSDPRDYKLDFSKANNANEKSADKSPHGRPFLSVLFACCNVYQRVYKTPDGKHYKGRRPRCMRTVTFDVGEGGTDERTFIAK